MTPLLDSFCMGEDEAISFLEETLKAQNIINELTGLAQSAGLYKQFSNVYNILDEILSPYCPDCEVKAKKFITSPAQLFDSDMANYPSGSSLSWTGEWFCPKCRHTIAFGKEWWRNLGGSTQ